MFLIAMAARARGALVPPCHAIGVYLAHGVADARRLHDARPVSRPVGHAIVIMAPIGMNGEMTQDRRGGIAAAEASAMTGVPFARPPCRTARSKRSQRLLERTAISRRCSLQRTSAATSKSKIGVRSKMNCGGGYPGSVHSRCFAISSATSTIMSSCPPTILRRPSSTRMARVSRPCSAAAFSAWRRKLE